MEPRSKNFTARRLDCPVTPSCESSLSIVQSNCLFATSHTNSAQNLAVAVHDVLDHGGGARKYMLVDATSYSAIGGQK
jgi:hypothetical protein